MNNAKRRLLFATALAALSLAPAHAGETPSASAPAEPAPAPAGQAAPAPAPSPAAPAPGRALLPKGPKWDAMPPDERDHVRRMAEFKAARDAAERDIVLLGERAEARKKAILGENEDAKKLFDRIAELREELNAATNDLQRIFSEDEELGKIAAEVEPARRIVEANQHSLNQEVVAAMHRRMAAQRAAYEKENPPPERPEPTPESTGLDPQSFTNLFVRPPRPASPVPPLTPNPDLKPPLNRRPGEKPLRPAPAPAPAAK